MAFGALSPGMAMLFMGSQVSRGARRAAERRLAVDERRQMRLIRRQEMREERAFRSQEAARGRKFGGQMEEARRRWAMEQEAGRLEARRGEAETAFGRQRQMAGEEWEAQERGRQFEDITQTQREPSLHEAAQTRLMGARAGQIESGMPGMPSQREDLSGMERRWKMAQGTFRDLTREQAIEEIKLRIEWMKAEKGMQPKEGAGKSFGDVLEEYMSKEAGHKMPQRTGAVPRGAGQPATGGLVPFGDVEDAPGGWFR